MGADPGIGDRQLCTVELGRHGGHLIDEVDQDLLELPVGGGSPTLMLKALKNGKKSARSQGTSQRRVSAPAPGRPARFQTRPCWPTMHASPVVSRSGLLELGTENAHCHQALAQYS